MNEPELGNYKLAGEQVDRFEDTFKLKGQKNAILCRPLLSSRYEKI